MAVTSRSIRLEWTPPPPDRQNGYIFQYVLNVTALGIRSDTYQLTTSNNASIEVSDLHPYTAYTIAIAAETSVGVGPFSQFIAVTTSEDSELY